MSASIYCENICEKAWDEPSNVPGAMEGATNIMVDHSQPSVFQVCTLDHSLSFTGQSPFLVLPISQFTAFGICVLTGYM